MHTELRVGYTPQKKKERIESGYTSMAVMIQWCLQVPMCHAGLVHVGFFFFHEPGSL